MRSILTFRRAALAIFLSPLAAHAGIVINVTQAGNDVLITGAGTANLAGLSRFAGSLTSPSVQSSNTFGNNIHFGNPGSNIGDIFRGITGIVGTAFVGAPDLSTQATSASGDTFGFILGPNFLVLPDNYVSGSPLAGTNLFANNTIAALGLIPGATSTISWGTGPNADTITLNVAALATAAVPTPTTLAGAAALLPLALLTRRRR